MTPNDVPALSITTTRHTDSVLVGVGGEIDMENSEVFRTALLAAMDDNPSALRVDMSKVGFCDSTGLKALLAARSAAVQAGATFDIVAASDQVQHLLDVVGLPRTLHADAEPPQDAPAPRRPAPPADGSV
ncbi:STAS domain-containing protein [Streptodolium elevatio]|uniref:Anti-sigma factor antagonist n=1 Tax=Streptodolium elevatio TaxID=3157996 RepID=A0ABV3DPW4_9ACTN